MKSLEEIKKQWEESHSKTEASGGKEDLSNIIRARVKRERKTTMEYFWAAFTYHVIIYAFMTHLFIRFWGDIPLMLFSGAGALLYIPFTIVLMRKFKGMANPKRNVQEADMLSHVKHQYRLLSEFFQFKKIFDWIGIPASAIILVWILFHLYIPGGMKENVPGGIVSFGIVLMIFSAITYFENKRRFNAPLEQLRSVLNDLKTE